MGERVWLLFLLVLAINWVHGDARSMGISNILETNYQELGSESKTSNIDAKNEQVCTLCEQFATQAIYYLRENKTQAEIIDTLHQSCSRLHSFQEECISLVDYYAPLIFLEIALVTPESFCSKVNLCENMALFVPQRYQDRCALCHHAVLEVLTKLKDPDTQLEILETLLKGCNKVRNYVKQCKKLVFEYAPLIMENAEQYLEKTDLCVSIHACKASASEEVDAEEKSLIEISLAEFEALSRDSSQV